MIKDTTVRPKILIVIPTLGKRIDYLRQTLESIAIQKPTLYDIVMILPLDNREAMSLAKKYGANTIADPGSLPAAVNAGIATAEPWHKYISWIGDDDLLEPLSLETTSKLLDDNPDSPVAYGHCRYITDTGEYIFTSRAGRIAPWLMTWGPDLIPCPGALFRLDSLKKVGEFDTLSYTLDLDMFLRLRKVGKFVSVNKVLASFRWHPDSITVANRSKSLAESEMVKRKYLPQWLRIAAPAWEIPVRLATHAAAKRVSAIARKKI